MDAEKRQAIGKAEWNRERWDNCMYRKKTERQNRKRGSFSVSLLFVFYLRINARFSVFPVFPVFPCQNGPRAQLCNYRHKHVY